MGIEVHRQLAAFGALASDDYRTVCSFRAVESCGRSSFQNTEALDVLWVDVYQTIGTDLSVVAKFGEVRAFTRAAVADGYTVQNDEWLVISSDGSQSAYVDGDSSGRTALCLCDADSRCFTVHGRGKVGCSCLYQFVCTDGTDGIADTFRVFFDTHCRYYDFFQLLGIFAECNLQVALLFSFCQVYLPGSIAHVSDRECCICRNGQCEVAVHIGNDAVVGAFLYDAGTDKRFSRYISYNACNGSVLLCKGCSGEKKC